MPVPFGNPAPTISSSLQEGSTRNSMKPGSTKSLRSQIRKSRDSGLQQFQEGLGFIGGITAGAKRVAKLVGREAAQKFANPLRVGAWHVFTEMFEPDPAEVLFGIHQVHEP